jgi:fused signal recognition particle receptor
VEIVLAILALLAVAGIIAFVVVSRRGRSRPRSPEPVERRGTGPMTLTEPDGVVATREPDAQRVGLAGRIRSVFGAGVADPWSELEGLLVGADVGPVTSARIVGDVRERFGGGDDPTALVAQEIRTILGEPASIHLPRGGLGVVLVVGVNGSGKTTTIGKLAARLANQGKRVSIAGSDTFRAAASEQLEVWAARAGAHLVQQARGADPGAVAFDAVQAAQARGSDVLIVDTAGRLHTKQPLMEELKKVRRVIEKAVGRPPDETLLVLDATTGQNGIAQARAFTEAVDVTGVALTKFDGTAKGGVVLAVRDQLGVPVKVVGTGEGVGDLEPFDGEAFTARLLDG